MQRLDPLTFAYLSNVYYQWQRPSERIVEIAWLPFQIPYTAAFTTAHGSESARAGAIIRVTSAGGLAGLGEASPLPAFTAGTLGDALAIIGGLAPHMVGRDLDQAIELLDQLDITAPGASAVACGFDTAIHDLAARAAGVPLAQLLEPHAAAAVPVNATIGAADLAAAAQAAARVAQAGIQCVKLKVGVARTQSAELARIAAVRAALAPGMRLRLDANAAWDVPEAIAIIRAAERYDLEFVEQPVAAGDLAGMARVRASVRTPIAADESVGGPEQARRVVAAGAADVLIVKPMMAGGLRRGREIIALAAAAGLQTLVTTTIDSGVGVAAALHLAATLPMPSLACGLATGALLAADLLSQPIIVRNGAIQLPDEPGLGVHIDERQARRYAGRWLEMHVDTVRPD
jgi:o-succinylbenzoate synthase